MTDENPICERSRRFPLVEQEIISKKIQQSLEDGIIRRSYSDFAAPVVLSKRKAGLCIAYRKIVKDRYPLPLIEDVLHKLQKVKGLDLKNGFFHVEIEESSRKYTAFVTHEGEYEFLRCPFGLCISGNQFQRYVNTVFQDLLQEDTIIVYMDDFFIPSDGEEDGIKNLHILYSDLSFSITSIRSSISIWFRN